MRLGIQLRYFKTFIIDHIFQIVQEILDCIALSCVGNALSRQTLCCSHYLLLSSRQLPLTFSG